MFYDVLRTSWPAMLLSNLAMPKSIEYFSTGGLALRNDASLYYYTRSTLGSKRFWYRSATSQDDGMTNSV